MSNKWQILLKFNNNKIIGQRQQIATAISIEIKMHHAYSPHDGSVSQTVSAGPGKYLHAPH